MWRYLRWVVLALVIAVVLVAALPLVLPVGLYKDQIIAQIRQATARDLKIDGAMSISFFPSFAVELNGVRLANATGAHDDDMATMEKLVVGAEFFPLLAGTVKVTHITLEKPVINLEIDENGRGNWVFGGSYVVATREIRPEDSDDDFSFKDVEIRGGIVTYRDARTGVLQAVQGIDMSIELPSLDTPMTVAGTLSWNKEALNVTGELRSPRAVIEGNESGINAKVLSPLMNASFDGTIDAGEGTLSGKVQFKTNSAQRLGAWFNLALPKVKAFGAMALSGEMRANPRQISFRNAEVALDELRGAGNITIDTTKTRPLVSGDFSLDKLDVNRLSNRRTGRAARAKPGWSDSPNDFSALTLLDAKLALRVGSVVWSDMKFGRGSFDLALNDGIAQANIKELGLYGGSAQGTMSIDARNAVPVMTVDATISGIDAGPFLWDLADLTIVRGTAAFALKLRAEGASERARMQTITGTGTMRFTNGAVRGVDLAAIAHNITAAIAGEALGPNAQTPFTSLTGSFLVRRGTAVNKNLTLLNPRVRLDGAGVVNVGGRMLNYRVEPKPLGRGPRLNLGIPVRIFGSWEHPQYEPEVGGVVNGAINSVLNVPGIAVDTIGDVLPPIGDKPNKKKTKSKGPLDAIGEFLGGN